MRQLARLGAASSLSDALLQGSLSETKTAQALYYRGLAYRELGKPGQAIADLTKAMAVNGSALIVFSEPANPNTARWLLGTANGRVLELSRLWAPDGHAPTLLTEAIAYATRELRRHRPDVGALISYADPEHDHNGGIYRAASWTFLGRSSERRRYTAADGKPVARRAFHSGKHTLSPAEVAALGVTESSVEAGKLRFARGLTAGARRLIAKKADRLQQ